MWPGQELAHLDPGRLTAETLDAAELAHLDQCFRCRSERRIGRAGAAAPRLGGWEVVGELGRGGMGRVYAVRHPELGLVRALKLLALESLTELAEVHGAAGRREEARSALREAEAVLRAVGARLPLAEALASRAALERSAGDAAAARAAVDEARAELARTGLGPDAPVAQRLASLT